MVGSDLTQTPSVSRLLQTPENHRKGFLFILFCIDFFRIEIRREGLAMGAARPLMERFIEKVEFTDTCWLWAASRNRDGYGQIIYERRPVAAHRIAYLLLVGPLPPERRMVIDHLCRVPACVNPDHLELVTQQENVLRGLIPARAAARTRCKNGHELITSNVYLAPRDGERVCRACRRDYENARYHAKRAKMKSDAQMA